MSVVEMFVDERNVVVMVVLTCFLWNDCRLDVCRWNVDEMSGDNMTLDYKSEDEMSVDEMSVVEMTFVFMTVDEFFVYEMTVDLTSAIFVALPWKYVAYKKWYETIPQ